MNRNMVTPSGTKAITGWIQKEKKKKKITARSRNHSKSVLFPTSPGAPPLREGWYSALPSSSIRKIRGKYVSRVEGARTGPAGVGRQRIDVNPKDGAIALRDRKMCRLGKKGSKQYHGAAASHHQRKSQNLGRENSRREKGDDPW